MTSFSSDCNRCVIIFTRYPQTGTTKTRMIPALGAIGAAELQRQMTEHTLSQVMQLHHQFPVNVGIFYTGGDFNLIKNWLGDQYDYVKQTSGDLGERLICAFQTAFNAGMEKVLIIGTDCPDVTPKILQQGFETLNNHDLVLGPAMDGGYYLIGTRVLIPKLFKGISWGTEKVFKETKDIALKLSLKMFFLAELADVDRPEDLAVWQKYN